MLTKGQCRSICRNLKREMAEDGVNYVLHSTAIVKERTDSEGKENLYTLNTGGWATQLTRRVMQEVIISCCKFNHVYISMGDGEVFFTDPRGNEFWVGDSLTITQMGFVNDYDYA